MRIIKLDAIESTNVFLKELAVNSVLDNYTTVVAKSQFKGKGQMGTSWVSEPNKNLLCSVLLTQKGLLLKDQRYLNYAVSLAVYNTLKAYNLPKLVVKWPNDILSGKLKVCGILIENSIKSEIIDSSIIGIGLNVNQEKFPEEIQASSIKNLLQKEVNLDDLLTELLENLKLFTSLLEPKEFPKLEHQYKEVLYKKNIPTMFRTSKNVLFMGMIVGISSSNKLQIQLEDDSIQEFGLKEVSFAN